MRKVLLTLILISPAAANSTLMLSSAELAIVTLALNNNSASSRVAQLRERSIHLDAIMYYAPSSWIMWVNGEKITSDNMGDYKVTNVGPQGANFEVMRDNVPHSFWLNINQSYELEVAKDD